MSRTTEGSSKAGTATGLNPALVALVAWAVPSAGHLLLGRRARAALFASIVGVSLGVGVRLGGNLYRPIAGQPLSLFATAGSMGAGIPYFLLRTGARYDGDPTAPGYEIGTVFLLSAGLMNILLVLDAWDIANGRKE